MLINTVISMLVFRSLTSSVDALSGHLKIKSHLRALQTPAFFSLLDGGSFRIGNLKHSPKDFCLFSSATDTDKNVQTESSNDSPYNIPKKFVPFPFQVINVLPCVFVFIQLKLFTRFTFSKN